MLCALRILSSRSDVRFHTHDTFPTCTCYRPLLIIVTTSACSCAYHPFSLLFLHPIFSNRTAKLKLHYIILYICTESLCFYILLSYFLCPNSTLNSFYLYASTSYHYAFTILPLCYLRPIPLPYFSHPIRNAGFIPQLILYALHHVYLHACFLHYTSTLHICASHSTTFLSLYGPLGK